MAISKAPRNVWKVRNKLGKKKERGTGLVILDTRCLGISPKIILNFAVSYTPVELDYIHIYIYMYYTHYESWIIDVLHCAIMTGNLEDVIHELNQTTVPHDVVRYVCPVQTAMSYECIYIYTHVVGQEC